MPILILTWLSRPGPPSPCWPTVEDLTPERAIRYFWHAACRIARRRTEEERAERSFLRERRRRRRVPSAIRSDQDCAPCPGRASEQARFSCERDEEAAANRRNPQRAERAIKRGASHEYRRSTLVAVPRAGLVHPAAGSAGQRRGQSDLARPREPPQRSWWRPLVVFGLVAALVAGAAFVASSVGVAARVTAAAGYLPSDGAVSYERTDTTRELKTTVGLAVTESARLSGVAGLLSTDSAFATKMLDEAYADRDRIQILRTTTTAINDPAATAQTIRFYRVNTGVELMGVSTPSEGYVYSPALVLLPAGRPPGEPVERCRIRGRHLRLSQRAARRSRQ